MQNEERITVLETQIRTLKRIVYGFGCLLVVGIVVGATSLRTIPEVIQAKSFQVISEDGKPVVVLDSQSRDCGITKDASDYYYGSIRTMNNYNRMLVSLGYRVDNTPGLTPTAYDTGTVTTHAINCEMTFSTTPAD
ncbi:MAG: hypothetical protein H8E91_00825 [Planctomycetes bacterium]|nr:hypothetical protein [Planctomycetota bacterium]